MCWTVTDSWVSEVPEIVLFIVVVVPLTKLNHRGFGWGEQQYLKRYRDFSCQALISYSPDIYTNFSAQKDDC
uniref:(California timema) hypothetical protein n=1 Tax=Timema californicum TaxID=61474 RepID=A0A7R9P7S1_TIMCA|nr:unnamed protein product [Timema californicum]